MKKYIKYIFSAAALALALGTTSCTGDLDVTPINPNLQTGDKISPDALLNKCYGVIALAGQTGPDGDSDVDGIDGGTSGYYRQLWNSNELTTDEAICGWGDDGIYPFCINAIDKSHPMLRGFYYRLYVAIAFCNQYLEDFSDYDATKTAEVRFLRALDYFYLMDGYANVPFTLAVSTAKPEQIQRADLFNWIEQELLDIEPSLSDARPKTSSDSDYGRVDKAAAWFLLMRLYLNAEVYTGSAQWSKAAEYAQKIMNSSYKLYTAEKNGYSAYAQLFMGDNGENGASVEAIFPILQDGLTTQSYGTSTFLMAGSIDANVHIFSSSVPGGNASEAWGGNRMRADLVAKFFPNNDAPNIGAYAMPEAAGDDRAMFDGQGREVDGAETLTDINSDGHFVRGFAVCKFNNFNTAGTSGHGTKYSDADVFLFRVAEAYLSYAEATARQNGGTVTSEGLKAINDLRSRAHAETKANFTLGEICDEWSRELYYEAVRRPTLIRFGRYAGNVNYNWAWKGGVKTGRNIDSHLAIFPLPETDLIANSNLVQNPGY
ncbi:MAG: RagB/SusD family nutrient uptake outer membrane protein [Prevotella sp.]|nr:RagB/SusD family nutrient uptake outer membrane protein [Prevotella sp.]